MATLGIVGGIAPVSTIEYYRLLVRRYREARPDGSYPSIIINSIDLTRLLSLVTAGDRDALTEFLVEELQRLVRAGADQALFASNTPHLVFDRLERRSPIPLISIVEAAAGAALAQELDVVGLLGTRFTMEGGFYTRAFDQKGIAVVTPNSEERGYIHDHYLGELAHEVYLPETRAGMLAIVERMRRDDGIEAVVLGGTELPMLFRDGPPPPIPFLDTMQLHVERALSVLLGPATDPGSR